MKTIGILGGMGPEATNRICNLITSLTPAKRDQDHVPVISYNNPKIPHRIDAVFSNSISPLPEMLRTAESLKLLGADFLIIPCNTAHHYIKDLQNSINIPFINYMDETVRYLKDNFPNLKKVGILGTSLTYQSKLYENPLKKENFSVILPSNGDQINITNAIYDIKAGKKDNAKILLIESANILHQLGAQVVIAGCTEIPLVLDQSELDFPLIDPSYIVAKRSIEIAIHKNHHSTSAKSQSQSLNQFKKII